MIKRTFVNMQVLAFLLILPLPCLFLSSPVLRAQTVKCIKILELNSGSGKKNIGSFLLGQKKQETYKPGSICRLKDNSFCVTDAVNGLILILDSDGKIKRKISSFKGGRFISPVDCCTGGNGNIYVSDSYLRVVIEFDSKYKFKKVFLHRPDSRITGLLFLNGKFYCVDTINHCIHCFNDRGILEFSFGKRGSGEGEFNFPTHITTGGKYIYITDALNFRVQVFDQSGTYIRQFGSNGRGGGNFSKPKGLAVDKEQRIFVTDAMFDNVQLFNIKGDFLYYFGSPGHQSGEFWMPSDVLVDSDNHIWVADTYNSRIQVFKLIKEVL